MDIDLYESLDGQTALVTGATRGIGKEIAVQLSDLGATVYAGARNPDDITTDDQWPIRLDVTVEDQISDAAARIADEAGHLDILVNDAGVYGPSGKLADLRTEAIEETLAVNLHGPIMVSKHMLPLLTERNGARIINVSSGGGQFTSGVSSSHAPYGISKAGLNALTSVLASQYPRLIMNSVCPGWVRTDMGGAGASRSVEKGAETPVWLSRFKPGSRSGRFWRDKAVLEW